MNISLCYFRNLLTETLIRKHYCQSLKKDAQHNMGDSGYESGTFFQVLHNFLSTLSINLFSTKHCKTSIEINTFYICCINFYYSYCLTLVLN